MTNRNCSGDWQCLSEDATLEAIEAVCNIENDLNVLETMESLVGKSLVKQTEADGEPRFAMLETIREYAGERLIAAGDEERVRERHRDYFLALAEEAEPKLIGAEQAEWLQRLEEEHENLRAALNWSLMESGIGRRSSALRGAATVLVDAGASRGGPGVVCAGPGQGRS